MQQINYIPKNELDQQKWNDCIEQSGNGLIYSYSWYLDAMCDEWDALVMNDYDAVMPLPHNRKYGIHYLYQPYFCASLGVFSRSALNAALVEAFLTKIPKRYKYIDIYLNHQNLYSLPDFPMTERVNYTLLLNRQYTAIANDYRTNLKRNIKKAEQSGLHVKEDIELDEILALAGETMQRVSSISNEEFNRFRNVYAAARKYQRAELMGIYSAANELLASAVFLFSHNRWYYILVGNHPNGKTLGASHYLIDRFIHKHAGTNTLLDFEGSDIRNLAFFYSSYGAAEERYPALRMNRLPKLLKWLKE